MMRQFDQRHLRTSMLLFLSLTCAGLGYCAGNSAIVGGGAIGACFALFLTREALQRKRAESPRRPTVSTPASSPSPAASKAEFEDPVDQMLAQSRYALLLRRQVVRNLDASQFHRAVEMLREEMAFVPEGDVEVFVGEETAPDDNADAASHGLPGRLCHIEPFFLDRWPVTNRQYYEFVAAGGYGEIALWKAKIWTAVIDMVDQTGLPGPRYWKDGRCLPGEEDLPVVGICWYEASAYARWLCKRLPTDAEWVKAASWPVPVEGDVLAQRRYPWGDAMDHTRANVWGSGPNRVVSVRDFAEGASVGGIYQLIGNVWEWTEGDFAAESMDGRMELPMPMKSIRGGAFDTYFDSQASARFQSGESPLSRRHNIGFRCAVSVRDLVIDQSSVAADADWELAAS